MEAVHNCIAHQDYSLNSRIIVTEKIDKLLMDKLSNVLSKNQKRTKIRNLLYEMSKKDKTIYNQSKSTANPAWVLSVKK